jgi:hypothetical protein
MKKTFRKNAIQALLKKAEQEALLKKASEAADINNASDAADYSEKLFNSLVDSIKIEGLED